MTSPSWSHTLTSTEYRPGRKGVSIVARAVNGRPGPCSPRYSPGSVWTM